MTVEEAQHVFDPFYRAHKKVMGVGVGLSICKQICQRLSGDIQVLLRPTGGCEFAFTMEVFESECIDVSIDMDINDPDEATQNLLSEVQQAEKVQVVTAI